MLPSGVSKKRKASLDLNPSLSKKPKTENNEAEHVIDFLVAIHSDNSVEAVRALLNIPYFNPAADNNFAIRYASEKGHNVIVSMLLKDPRVDPEPHKSNIFVDSPLALAVANDHFDTVQVLLNSGRINPSQEEVNPLLKSAIINSGNCKIVSLLLEKLTVQLLDKKDFEKLILCSIEEQDNEMVSLLLKKLPIERLGADEATNLLKSAVEKIGDDDEQGDFEIDEEDYDITKLLLNNRDITKKIIDWAPLIEHACKFGKERECPNTPKLLKLLLESIQNMYDIAEDKKPSS